MPTVRLLTRRVAVGLCCLLVVVTASAQYVSRNINMVSGTGWPGGDPFLQRQNEPSLATSTRNPMHLVAGANDYRTVDLPGLPDGEETGDAWLGLFISLDGGLTWRSTLVPGYPQDSGSTEPIHLSDASGITFNAAADPMVRSGLNGMFYYSGIALRRPTTTTPPVSAVFVARYNDFNDREASNPVRYLGMSVVADGRAASKFLDKPSLAVDIPRFGAQPCSVGGQTFYGGNVYVVYTDIATANGSTTAQLWFSRSIDCGSTWSSPKMISGTNTLNQGSVMAIDTRTGNLYVVWRRIATATETNALLVAKSVDGGKTFSAPVVIRSIVPFEQGTTSASFRTPMYPSAVTDADGRLYVAWSERSGPTGPQTCSCDKPDGRIMVANSPDGVTWSSPVMVAPTAPVAPLTGRGHQFMPALSYASGKVMLVYYDAREDSTVGLFSWNQVPPTFNETRKPVGDLDSPLNPDNVFNNYIQDAPVIALTDLRRRHTLDLRASQASPGPMPLFEESRRVSVYRFGYSASNPTIRQLEFNPPNFKMFKQGTVPFFGDYIDLAPQYPFISSLLNLPLPAPVFHAAWTDNRDVRPPVDGQWQNYTPPYSLSRLTTSKIDGSTLAPCVADHTGMRNQNIYTSRITAGLFFASPGNDKPLGTIQRAFVVTVQNSKFAPQSYRLQIVNQPFGGKATFQQLPLSAPALTTLDITVNARSSASRSVFVTSIQKNAPVGVTVTEITAAGGTTTSASLTSATVLNPDPTSPDIASPDIGSPDIASTEVYTPDIGSPDIGSPDIGSPDIGSPDIGSPDIGSPDIGSPDIGSPDIGSPSYATPDIGSPDIGSPDIGSGSITDTTWPVTNDGNTTASYSTKLFQTAPIPSGLKLQLILHQSYKTPISRNCILGTETHHILLNNVPSPTVLTSIDGIGSPDIGSASAPTVAIAPGGSVNLTVRILDPVHKNRIIDASQFLTPVVVAHAVNTADLTNPNPQPAISMVITTPSLADGIRGVVYSPTQMTALFGVAPLNWSVAPVIEGPSLPYGLSLSPGGLLSGTPTTNGTFTFTVNVTDSATPVKHHASRSYTIHISDPLAVATSTLPAATQGSPYVFTLASSGGLAPIHWVLTAGSLPPNFSLSDDGTISGTTATIGAYTFSVSASDSSVPRQTTQPFSFQMAVAAPPSGCGTTVSTLFDNSNTFAVSNNPNGAPSPTFTTNGQTVCLDSVWTYHWNGGRGATPGTIGVTSVCAASCQVLGPWQAAGSSGQGGALNVNWTAAVPSNTQALLSPNTNYQIVDSNATTWSENTQSNGYGFTKVYVRSYTPPTFTVVVHLLYNGAPRTPTTAPGFFLRDNGANTVISNDHIVWNNDDTVTISGIPAGNYGFEVVSAETSTVRHPGSFYGFANFDAAPASKSGFNLTLTRLIHLKSPYDNSGDDASSACPSTLSYAAVSQVTWDNIEIAATYNYTIEKIACPYVTPTTIASGSISDNSGVATFTQLAPNAPNEYYRLTLYAYSGNYVVGQIMTNFVNRGGWGWDLRFTVPQPAAINLTPANAGSFVQGQSFNETRVAEVTVQGASPVTVSSMTLGGLNASSGGAAVGARIYDSSWQLVASGNVNAPSGADQTVTVPIAAVLNAAAVYRVGFFVQALSTPGSNSGTFLQPSGWAFSTAAGWSTPAYAGSPDGWFQITKAWSFPTDSSPVNPYPSQNLFVPQVTMNVSR